MITVYCILCSYFEFSDVKEMWVWELCKLLLVLCCGFLLEHSKDQTSRFENCLPPHFKEFLVLFMVLILKTGKNFNLMGWAYHSLLVGSWLPDLFSFENQLEKLCEYCKYLVELP